VVGDGGGKHGVLYDWPVVTVEGLLESSEDELLESSDDELVESSDDVV
jgi:hypothetical protein